MNPELIILAPVAESQTCDETRAIRIERANFWNEMPRRSGVRRSHLSEQGHVGVTDRQ